jgi:putative N6-adenine-specific DNA methylase
MHSFYLICPINFEKSLIKEIKLKCIDKNVEVTEITKGGIEIKCELNYGLNLNKILKTPTRIVLRIKNQKCRDFPKLYNIIKKINWKSYLTQYEPLIKVSCSESRIIHSDKAKKTVQDAISFFFNANKISQKILDRDKDKSEQLIMLRLVNDQLTISIDTSGDALYIRGGRDDRGHASIRENYAASLLIYSLPKNHEQLNLLDPMCGTGTFLYEALSFYKENNDREYIWTRWPLKTDPLSFTFENKKLYNSFSGYDIDKELIERNKKQEGIHFEQRDFFESNFSKSEFVISNLPYGKRVKIEGVTHDYFQKVTEKLKGLNYALLLPETAKVKQKDIISFNNNGIKVKLISNIKK